MHACRANKTGVKVFYVLLTYDMVKIWIACVCLYKLNCIPSRGIHRGTRAINSTVIIHLFDYHQLMN